MITLTTPPSINSVLGGNVPISYPKFVVSKYTMDPIGGIIEATLRITSTTNPEMTPILGQLRIVVPQSLLEISVQQLDYYRKLTLTGPQNASVTTIITNAQNALENGLINLGLVSGTQASGT